MLKIPNFKNLSGADLLFLVDPDDDHFTPIKPLFISQACNLLLLFPTTHILLPLYHAK
jgi:hypothetical protein